MPLLDRESERLESQRVPPTSRNVPFGPCIAFHPCHGGKTTQETIGRQTHTFQCVGLSTPVE